MAYSPKDKNIESKRYNKRAEKMLLSNESLDFEKLKELFDRKTYGVYEAHHKKYIKKSSLVLELGAGTGRLTKTLLDSGANIVASDISPSSLEIIKKRYSEYQNNLIVQVADIEKLPFEENYFDVVTSAGSLSYGDNKIVMNEINRILKPGGIFICVDSLNDNPIYRLNRWIAFMLGKRSLSTINNMPSLKMINEYKLFFDEININFFGSIVWLFPFLSLFFSKNYAVSIIEKFDTIIDTKKSSFKFVMVLRKR